MAVILRTHRCLEHTLLLPYAGQAACMKEPLSLLLECAVCNCWTCRLCWQGEATHMPLDLLDCNQVYVCCAGMAGHMPGMHPT